LQTIIKRTTFAIHRMFHYAIIGKRCVSP
jgi:hypothetical protein